MTNYRKLAAECDRYLMRFAGEAKLNLLLMIWDNPMTAAEINAAANGGSNTGIYNLLTKLERSGLVQYTSDPPNGRRPPRRYSLTPMAEKALRFLAKVV